MVGIEETMTTTMIIRRCLVQLSSHEDGLRGLCPGSAKKLSKKLSKKLWFIKIERDIKKVSVYGLEIDEKSKRGNVQVNGPSTQA